MSGLFHPILTNPNYSTVILSWYDGRLHFFERIPPDQNAAILLDTYYAAYLFSFLAATLLSWRWFKTGSLKIRAHQVFDLLLVGFLGILFGAKLGYVFFYNFEYYWQNPSQIFLNWSGMASHGAIIGSVLGIWLYCRKAKISTLMILDHAAIYAAIGAFFIRIANFLNAELYGRSTGSSLGMHFPIRDGLGRSLFVDQSDQLFVINTKDRLEIFDQTLPRAYESFLSVQEALPKQIYQIPFEKSLHTVARLITDPSHPSQLYQMFAAGILLTVFLLWLKSRTKTTGMVTAAFLVGYGAQRIAMEFFRQQDIQRSSGLFELISMGQLLSLALIATGAYLIFRLGGQAPGARPKN